MASESWHDGDGILVKLTVWETPLIAYPTFNIRQLVQCMTEGKAGKSGSITAAVAVALTWDKTKISIGYFNICASMFGHIQTDCSGDLLLCPFVSGIRQKIFYAKSSFVMRDKIQIVADKVLQNYLSHVVV